MERAASSGHGGGMPSDGSQRVPAAKAQQRLVQPQLSARVPNGGYGVGALGPPAGGASAPPVGGLSASAPSFAMGGACAAGCVPMAGAAPGLRQPQPGLFINAAMPPGGVDEHAAPPPAAPSPQAAGPGRAPGGCCSSKLSPTAPVFRLPGATPPLMSLGHGTAGGEAQLAAHASGLFGGGAAAAAATPDRRGLPAAPNGAVGAAAAAAHAVPPPGARAEAAGASAVASPGGACANESGLSPAAPEFVMGTPPPELRMSVAAPEFRPAAGGGGGRGSASLLLPASPPPSAGPGGAGMPGAASRILGAHAQPGAPPALAAPDTPPPSTRLSFLAAGAAAGGVSGGEEAGEEAGVVACAQAYVREGGLHGTLRAQRAAEHAGAGARAAELEAASVRAYHSLVPLDDVARGHSVRGYGVPTTVFRATRAGDGQLCCVRRIDGSLQATEAELSEAARPWLALQHPALVQLHEAFISAELGGKPRPYFVHDFYGGAATVEAAFFVSMGAECCAEGSLWSLCCQLVGLLWATHACGLACHGLEPARLLLTGGERVRLNGVGVCDLTRTDSRTLAERQADDVASLGRLLRMLACRSPAAGGESALGRALEQMGGTCSAELCSLVALLGSSPTPLIGDVVGRVSARLMDQCISAHAHADALQWAYRSELESARIGRLLIKLGFVNERPEFEGHPAWSETGDRYLLKLFRDAVFHAVDEEGAPVVSYAHVLSALNKLDIGADEHLLLHGRDEHGSRMVVSYRDLRQLVESAFAELVAAQQAAAGPPSGRAAGGVGAGAHQPHFRQAPSSACAPGGVCLGAGGTQSGARLGGDAVQYAGARCSCAAAGGGSMAAAAAAPPHGAHPAAVPVMGGGTAGQHSVSMPTAAGGAGRQHSA